MNRHRRALAAGVLVLAAAVPGGAAGAGPVEEAHAAARHVPFSARVTVSWVDLAGRHVTNLRVRAAGGLVRVDGPQSARAGLVLGDGWLVVGRAGSDVAVAPATDRKYQVLQLPGPDVAGRTTTLVVLRAAGRVRERLAVDKDTGLVLRRELFAADGQVVRVVTVTELDLAGAAPPAVRPAGDRAEGVRAETLGAAYAAPRTLAGGYERVAAYRRGRVVQLVYTDGLHGLSLFVQPGRLDRGRLPAGGEAVRVGEVGAVHHTWAGGEIVTWQSGPVVRTLMGDAVADEVLTAARSLPSAPGFSLVSRLRRASRHVTEVVSGGA